MMINHNFEFILINVTPLNKGKITVKAWYDCATDHLIVMHAEHSFLPGDMCITWNEKTAIVVYKMYLSLHILHLSCLLWYAYAIQVV